MKEKFKLNYQFYLAIKNKEMGAPISFNQLILK